jgi:hypothetical protein
MVAVCMKIMVFRGTVLCSLTASNVKLFMEAVGTMNMVFRCTVLAVLAYVDHTCLSEDFYTYVRSESRVVQLVFVLEYNSQIESQFVSLISGFSHVYSKKAASVQSGYSCSYLSSNKTVSLYFDVHIVYTRTQA